MTAPRPHSLRAWWLAARPKTLSGAAVPVILGIVLAVTKADTSIPVFPALLCLLFAFLMQINANFMNDLYDYLKGSDREDRLGPERACAQGWISARAMKWGIGMTSAGALGVGLGILYFGGAWWLLAVGALCLVFAFIYTAGPYPLAYHGWGDVAVLIFFGWVPVCCTYYVLTGGVVSVDVWLAATACGLVIDTLLMVNNYRDYEQDARIGKRTLVVRFGKRMGEWTYLCLGFMACLCLLPFCFDGRYLTFFLSLFFLLPHVQTCVQMRTIGQGKALNTILAQTSRNILFFGILVSAGLLLDSLL